MINEADYINYLICSQRNYTCTHLADHLPGISHDQVNRFLANSALDSSQLRELVAPLLTDVSGGFLLVDDSVQDKGYSKFIEMARVQYSGNVHGLVRGINLVNMVYTTGEPGDFLPVDFRIYAPEIDGLTKNNHFCEMFSRVATSSSVPTRTVLFDSWYSAANNLKQIHRAGWTFFTTLKSNRLVRLSKETAYQSLSSVDVSAAVWNAGLEVRIQQVPFPVYLFKVVAPDGSIEWLITNTRPAGLTQQKAEQIHRNRWHIEEFHRSFKQLTGSEKCQCRRANAQRNHLTCCYLAWISLRQFARKTQQTIYQASQKIWSSLFAKLLQKQPVPVLIP